MGFPWQCAGIGMVGEGAGRSKGIQGSRFIGTRGGLAWHARLGGVGAAVIRLETEEDEGDGADGGTGSSGGN